MTAAVEQVADAVTRRHKPDLGRVVRPRREDFHQYLITDLAPERAKRILRTAAYGDPAAQDVLFNEMLERDPHLVSVYNTRLMGLTGLDWEILPANQVGKNRNVDENLAQEAADYCQEVLDEAEGLDAALCHMADAIGRGLAVVEIVWEIVAGTHRIAALEPVTWSQVVEDPVHPGQLRILLEGDATGMALDGEAAPFKFIRHEPRSLGGSSFRGGLLRIAILFHMLKRYGLKWWSIGIEHFGLPLRVAKYPESATKDVKDELMSMLKDMGTLASGIFPQGTEFEMHEFKHSGQWPHERMLAYVDAALSKLLLGQTLTTEIGGTGGAFAAAQTHDEVRKDLRDDDIRKEGDAIRSQALKPLVLFKFGPDAPVPYFRRVVEEPKDLLQTAQLANIVVNQLGARVPVSFVQDELGVPVVDGEDTDAPLPGQSSGLSSPFDFGGGQPRASRRNGHRTGDTRLTAHRHLTDVVLQRRSPLSAIGPWILSAILASQAHTENVVAQIQAAIEHADSFGDTPSALVTIFDRLPIADMVELERQFLLGTQLHGRWTTRQRADRRQANQRRGEHILSAHQDRIDFERLPFIAAIESLRDRLGLDPETFLDLDREARSRAWRVAGAWNMDLLAVIHTNLVNAIAAGETGRDFRLRIPEMLDRRGWSGENPWHADVVHWQNFTMAHAAGRCREYAANGIGHWRFAATGDSCPICEPFIGKVFPLDDRRAWPPLHFYCDCTDEVVFDEELRPGEAQDSSRIESPALDTELSRRGGFRWDPAEYAHLEPLRLSRFPEELRAVFDAFARKQGWEVAE